MHQENDCFATRYLSNKQSKLRKQEQSKLRRFGS